MKSLPLLALMVVAVGLVSSVRGHTSLDVPPGVEPEQWIAITPALGFVVVEEAGSKSVRGYFLTYRGNLWQRMEATVPPRIQRVEAAR
jgi:hypothetical protein